MKPQGKTQRRHVGVWSWNSQVMWSKIEQGQPNECWSWTGARGPQSNLFGVKKGTKPQMTQLPRILYRDITGEDCEGMEVTHTCNNRYCCNPNHFMPVKLNTSRGRPPKDIEQRRKLQQGTLTPITWTKQ
jgi:hypothetical protein